MGRFGEAVVREAIRARGEKAFDLNVGDHGIDVLARSPGADGKPAYRVIEVKTRQTGTDFPLRETGDGRQLSHGWIEKRLATAAKRHPDAETRKAAEEALNLFRKTPAGRQ